MDSIGAGSSAVADTLTKSERSAVMRRIRSKNTGPEMIVRSCVHRLGYRFRLHDRRLPGSPDIVLRRLRMVVFVHGCFWHRHQGCQNCSTPRTRVKFWTAKFKANRARDARARVALASEGWRIITVWECETDDLPRLAAKLGRALSKATQQAGQSTNESSGRRATRRRSMPERLISYSMRSTPSGTPAAKLDSTIRGKPSATR